MERKRKSVIRVVSVTGWVWWWLVEVFCYIYIYIYMYHHYHHVTLLAQISLTLSHHTSLSSIAPARSSRQHPVSAQSCYIQVLASRPTFARPCEGVHRSTSLMCLSLLLKLCPACLVRLTWIVFVRGDRWPYSCCLWSVVSSTSIQLAAFVCNCRQAFSPHV